MATRTRLQDLLAIAALPDLERLAAVFAAHDPSERGPLCGHLALVVFLAGRWVTGSATELDSLLASGVWNRMRIAALRVGRTLPAAPPTYNALSAFRVRVEEQGPDAFGQLLEDVLACLTAVSVPLAEMLGLLPPGRPDYDDLNRANCLVADGSVFKPASSLRERPDGTVPGSRSTGVRGPRVVETRPGKQDPDGTRAEGVPIEIVSVRDDRPHSRVVLAVDGIHDGDETAAAKRTTRRVLDVAGNRVHSLAYDRLLAGADLRDLLHMGVLPVVAMKSAQKTQPHVKVPFEHAPTLHAGKGTARKTRLVFRQIGLATHLSSRGECVHVVAGRDGSVVMPRIGTDVTWRTPTARRVDLQASQSLLGDIDWHGTYEAICEGRPVRHVVHLTDTIKVNGHFSAMANTVRPIPDADPQFATVHGWRQDAESTYSTVKRRMHLDGRACSYDPDHFVLDVVGAALWVNAVAHLHHAEEGTA